MMTDVVEETTQEQAKKLKFSSLLAGKKKLIKTIENEIFLELNAHLARTAAVEYAENENLTADEAFEQAKQKYELLKETESPDTLLDKIEVVLEFNEIEEAILRSDDDEAVKELIPKAIFVTIVGLIEEYNGEPIKALHDFENLKTKKAKRAKEYLLDELSIDEDGANIAYSKYILELGIERIRRIRRITDDTKPKNTIRRKISLRYLTEWTYPIDTVHQNLFRAKVREKLALNVVGQADKQKGINADIFVMYDFDKDSKVTISRQLTIWDKRVYAALANLYLNGQTETTATHVYREATRNKSVNPTPKQIKDLMLTIEKLRVTSVYIDTTEEHELYPQEPLIKGVIPLLEVGYFTEQVEINGAIVGSTIKISSLPPLFNYAVKKGQVTTLDADLLKLPHLQAVESNINLHDYLTTRIVQMKRAVNKAQLEEATAKSKPKGNRNTKAHVLRNTILLSTIEEKCGFTTPKLKRELPNKLNKILEEFKKQKFIKGYKWEQTKIKIVL